MALKSGLLYKKGLTNPSKRWDKRWVDLEDDRMVCYDKDGRNVLETLWLHEIDSIYFRLSVKVCIILKRKAIVGGDSYLFAAKGNVLGDTLDWFCAIRRLLRSRITSPKVLDTEFFCSLRCRQKQWLALNEDSYIYSLVCPIQSGDGCTNLHLVQHGNCNEMCGIWKSDNDETAAAAAALTCLPARQISRRIGYHPEVELRHPVLGVTGIIARSEAAAKDLSKILPSKDDYCIVTISAFKQLYPPEMSISQCDLFLWQSDPHTGGGYRITSTVHVFSQNAFQPIYFRVPNANLRSVLLVSFCYVDIEVETPEGKQSFWDSLVASGPKPTARYSKLLGWTAGAIEGSLETPIKISSEICLADQVFPSPQEITKLGVKLVVETKQSEAIQIIDVSAKVYKPSIPIWVEGENRRLSEEFGELKVDATKPKMDLETSLLMLHKKQNFDDDDDKKSPNASVNAMRLTSSDVYLTLSSSDVVGNTSPRASATSSSTIQENDGETAESSNKDFSFLNSNNEDSNVIILEEPQIKRRPVSADMSPPSSVTSPQSQLSPQSTPLASPLSPMSPVTNRHAVTSRRGSEPPIPTQYVNSMPTMQPQYYYSGGYPQRQPTLTAQDQLYYQQLYQQQQQLYQKQQPPPPQQSQQQPPPPPYQQQPPQPYQQQPPPPPYQQQPPPPPYQQQPPPPPYQQFYSLPSINTVYSTHPSYQQSQQPYYYAQRAHSFYAPLPPPMYSAPPIPPSTCYITTNRPSITQQQQKPLHQYSALDLSTLCDAATALSITSSGPTVNWVGFEVHELLLYPEYIELPAYTPGYSEVFLLARAFCGEYSESAGNALPLWGSPGSALLNSRSTCIATRRGGMMARKFVEFKEEFRMQLPPDLKPEHKIVFTMYRAKHPKEVIASCELPLLELIDDCKLLLSDGTRELGWVPSPTLFANQPPSGFLRLNLFALSTRCPQDVHVARVLCTLDLKEIEVRNQACPKQLLYFFPAILSKVVQTPTVRGLAMILTSLHSIEQEYKESAAVHVAVHGIHCHLQAPIVCAHQILDLLPESYELAVGHLDAASSPHRFLWVFLASALRIAQLSVINKQPKGDTDQDLRASIASSKLEFSLKRCGEWIAAFVIQSSLEKQEVSPCRLMVLRALSDLIIGLKGIVPAEERMNAVVSIAEVLRRSTISLDVLNRTTSKDTPAIVAAFRQSWFDCLQYDAVAPNTNSNINLNFTASALSSLSSLTFSSKKPKCHWPEHPLPCTGDCLPCLPLISNFNPTAATALWIGWISQDEELSLFNVRVNNNNNSNNNNNNEPGTCSSVEAIKTPLLPALYLHVLFDNGPVYFSKHHSIVLKPLLRMLVAWPKQRSCMHSSSSSRTTTTVIAEEEEEGKPHHETIVISPAVVLSAMLQFGWKFLLTQQDHVLSVAEAAKYLRSEGLDELRLRFDGKLPSHADDSKELLPIIEDEFKVFCDKITELKESIAVVRVIIGCALLIAAKEDLECENSNLLAMTWGLSNRPTLLLQPMITTLRDFIDSNDPTLVHWAREQMPYVFTAIFSFCSAHDKFFSSSLDQELAVTVADEVSSCLVELMNSEERVDAANVCLLLLKSNKTKGLNNFIFSDQGNSFWFELVRATIHNVLHHSSTNNNDNPNNKSKYPHYDLLRCLYMPWKQCKIMEFETMLRDRQEADAAALAERDEEETNAIAAGAASLDVAIRLLSSDSMAGQSIYKEGFFLMYRAFLTSDQLLMTLMKHYIILTEECFDTARFYSLSEGQNIKQSIHTKTVVNDRAKARLLLTLNAMCYWIENHFSDFQQSIMMGTLLTLTMEVVAAMNSAHARKLVTTISRTFGLQNKAKYGVAASVSIPSLSQPQDLAIWSKNLLFMHWPAVEVARQLSIIDSELFQKIQRHEFLDCAWNKADKLQRAPNITAMIARFNAVSNWASASVLQCKDVVARCQVLGRLIQIAAACSSINNFNAALAIFSGLSHSSIYRLKKTRDALSAATLTIFEELETLFKTDKSYLAMRNKLKSVEPPCIPYLGVWLTDVTFSLDGNPTRTAEGKINLKKFTLITATVRQVLLFQQVQYEYHQDAALQAYLRNMEQLPDDELYALSEEVEPRAQQTN